MKKISIVIPSYNSGLTVEYSIKALNSQTKKDLISEIIIVDSSDDKITKRILSKYESSILKVINTSSQTIPAIARNIGAAESKEDILVFLDSDIVLSSDWVENIITAYNRGCYVGSGSVSLSDFQKNKILPIAQFYLQLNEYLNVGQIRQKNFVPSCNMFCEKKIFQKIGGFPKIRAAEDVLFGLKVSETEKVWFIPKANAYHIFREDLKSFIKNQILLGKYAILYRKKYFDGLIYKNLIPFFLLPLFLFIKYLKIFFRIKNSGWPHISKFVVVQPLFLIGLMFWGIGFAGGCFKKE